MLMNASSLFRHWGDRWHAAQSIQARTSQSVFYGLGIYITMTVALIIAAVIVNNSLRFTEQNILFVSRQPIFLPILVNTIVTSIYLALSTSIIVSRERDQGTLETLMHGPVDETAFLLGNFLAQLKVYGGLVLVAFVWANLLTWVLHLQYSFELAIVLITSIATTAAIIALGLFVAMWGGRSRTTLVYFILIILVIVGIQISDEIVSNLVLASNPTFNDPLITVRNVLASATSIVKWLSPYSQLEQAMGALLDRAYLNYLVYLGVVLLQGTAFFTGSIWLLRRKGIRD